MINDTLNHSFYKNSLFEFYNFEVKSKSNKKEIIFSTQTFAYTHKVCCNLSPQVTRKCRKYNRKQIFVVTSVIEREALPLIRVVVCCSLRIHRALEHHGVKFRYIPCVKLLNVMFWFSSDMLHGHISPTKVQC